MQNHNLIPLCEIPIGSSARVKKLNTKGGTRRRMLDLGIILNTEVKALHKSPSGDPTAYQIRGAVIALRDEDASEIMVSV